MSAASGFVRLLRELGLMAPERTASFRAEGETGEAIGQEQAQFSQSVFAPEDLVMMQSVFDRACIDRNAHTPEHRAAIATVVFDGYKVGERNYQKLLDAAMAAAL